MYEHNALGYRSGLALCLTKVRNSRAHCPATALIEQVILFVLRNRNNLLQCMWKRSFQLLDTKCLKVCVGMNVFNGRAFTVRACEQHAL